MRKEFLEDYMASESEEYASFEKEFLKSNEILRYPQASRFRKLNEPLVYYDPFCFNNYKEKLWSQVPFAGTLIISLRNIRSENCLEYQGFDPSDVPKLIDLAKDQGKVQFGFQADLRLYEGLDYLEPIFSELKPPLLRSLPRMPYLDDATLRQWDHEFIALANVRYAAAMKQMIMDEGESEDFFKNMMNKRFAAYHQMKLLNMNEAIETVSNYMIDDPIIAEYLFEKYLLLINPIFDALTPNVNIGLSELHRYGYNTGEIPERVRIPEIGNFIMEKTILHPSSYQSCMDVISHYSDNELYKVMAALYDSIKHHKKDAAVQDVAELRTVLDNAWKDSSKLKGKSETIKDGISVVLGLCGGLMTTQWGGLGLLAGLGFQIAERKLSVDLSLSEKIIRKINPDYLVNVFDFQRKIPIKS